VLSIFDFISVIIKARSEKSDTQKVLTIKRKKNRTD